LHASSAIRDGRSVKGRAARRGRLFTDFEADVYWWEPDGRVATISPGDGVYLMACIHPSGEHAVFWGGASGRPRLWIGDGAGDIDALTEPHAAARHPAYNCDGDLLVYSRSEHRTETIEHIQRGVTAVMPADDAMMSIVVRASDGRWERQLTSGEHQDQRPALSPDGSQVVFVSNRLRSYELWLVATDGMTPPKPLLTGWRAYRPWWSVDGKWIYFVSLGATRHQVHVLPAGGGTPKPLANDDRGDTHGPFADPEGGCLIVHSTREGSTQQSLGFWGLYELPLDGTPARRLVPPGHARGAHGSRARNGVLTFDVSRTGRRISRARLRDGLPA